MSAYLDLYNLASQKFAASSTDMPIADWITEHTTLRRRPFTYDRYPFQEQIANDEHPNMCVVKPSQVGLTEIQIRKFLAMLRRENGISGILTFPNENMFKRTYTSRIAPIIQGDAVFNPPTVNKPTRRMDLIQIGDSFGYITGCGESDATNINADVLFHDELDLSPQDMIGLFQSRLQGSDKRITQSFSTPTYVGYGVDRTFSLSDQHYYLVKCTSCNHRQFPTFDHKFVAVPDLKFDVEHLTDLSADQISVLNLKTAYMKCERCGKRLDVGNKKLSEWVPMFPSRTASRGYRMNPFSTNRIDLQYVFGQLLKFREKESIKGFYNTVLGEPYTHSDAQLQVAEIEQCLAPNGNIPNVSRDIPVYMGIDMGQICHIVLVGDVDENGKDPFFLFDSCRANELSERIASLQSIYTIVQCCVDRYPYTPTVDALRENTNGMVMPIHYGSSAAILAKLDEADNLIYYMANRTMTLDRVRTSIVNNNAVLAGYGPYRETLIAHLRDMIRDESPEKEPEWKKQNGNDHFFHAAGYAMLARRVAENIYTKHLSKNLMVLAVNSTNVGNNIVVPKATKTIGFNR